MTSKLKLTETRSTDITLCAPVELTLSDACRASYPVQISVSYFSEASQFRLICPTPDGGSDGGPG